MRIVGGFARGRRLRAPASGTRPTSERAREALFNRLATLLDLDGLRVLDLFAGSGAVGLEALSRGAAHVSFVESDARAVEILRANVRLVTAGADRPGGTPGDGPGAATVHRRPVETFLSGPPPPVPFDFVFADPPYVRPDDTVAALLAQVAAPPWCVPGGILVVERSARGVAPDWPASVEALASKRYGEGVLWYGRTR